MKGLSPSQRNALVHASAMARAQHEPARREAGKLLAELGIPLSRLDEAVAALQKSGRVAVHFHPDRIGRSGKNVVESLLAGGHLENQFETGLSSGSLTPFHGGPRDTWEKQLFGGAYQTPDSRPAERPKYGALDLMQFADGPAPRFGSCYFRLKPEVSRQCSFTDKDSYLEPTVFGTHEWPLPILQALLQRAHTEPSVLGAAALSPARLLDQCFALNYPPVNFGSRFGRTLDDYLEAQIHGPISLKQDVESVVADPSFRGTSIEDGLQALSAKFGIALDWHAGFVLAAHEVPAEFRGPRIPVLAQRIADQGTITAAVIGQAAVSLARNRAAWADWGTYEEALQHIKQLWHVLAFYGKPFIARPPGKG